MRSKINYQHVPLATAKRAINGPDGISITQRGITSGFRCDTAKAAAIAGLGKTRCSGGRASTAIISEVKDRSQTRMLDIAGTATSFVSATQQGHG